LNSRSIWLAEVCKYIHSLQWNFIILRNLLQFSLVFILSHTHTLTRVMRLAKTFFI
jgi:hypothetical protein